jgi:hypothetical protein
VSAQSADGPAPVKPDEYEVIHLGGEAAAIVPLTELRRLQAGATLPFTLGSVDGLPESSADLVAGLRKLADFIEANPGLPVPRWVHVTHFPDGADPEQHEEVDRVADILGRETSWNSERTQYTVSRSFGPVTYKAVLVLKAEKNRYQAHMSKYHQDPGTRDA